MIGIFEKINFQGFIDGFYKIGRGEQFSSTALAKLYEYYNNLSEEIDEPIWLDPIAICCYWAESSKEDIIAENDLCESEDPTVFLEKNTVFFELDNGKILYQQF